MIKQVLASRGVSALMLAGAAILIIAASVVIREMQRRHALSVLKENFASCENWEGFNASPITRDIPRDELEVIPFVRPMLVRTYVPLDKTAQIKLAKALANLKPRVLMLTGVDSFEAEFLRILGTISSIESLELTSSRGIGDHNIAFLPRMRNLRDLLIQGTSITDAALPVFGSCGKLRTLAIGNTEITDKAASIFAAAHPDVDVIR
jgi:hypothetical protein